MAKKIKFPLKMKNGAEVRTLDELKENFDLESVLGYFADERLATWLADRYYDEKAKAVSALSSDTPDLNAKICEILEVEYKAEEDSTDLKSIQRRSEKLKILSAFTDDKEILSNIDIVAMDQNELFDILDDDPEIVYLYGEKFDIPFGKKNVCYIGLNNPLVILDSNKELIRYNELAYYEESGIQFKNVKYDDVNPYITRGEKLFLEGKYKEAFPLIEQAANNGNPRAMYLMACYYDAGYETVKCNRKERDNWCEKAYSYKEPISMCGYAILCPDGFIFNDFFDWRNERKKICSLVFSEIKNMAENNDIIAQFMLAACYDIGYDEERDYEAHKADRKKSFEIYLKLAEKGIACAQYELGNCYDKGYSYGLDEDHKEAFKWYRKAAEQGHAGAQRRLVWCYEKGGGVKKDKKEAAKWHQKSAKQGKYI